jgi:predicted ABC-type ATPase
VHPWIIVVAGPSGSGKSTAFPVDQFGVAFFNADDRAAELNGGSYVGVSPEIRRLVNAEFELFIRKHIESRESFAFETTLRTAITFSQAAEAKKAGFHAGMIYICSGSPELSIQRVADRGNAGGHSAPAKLIEEIYHASLSNLRQAVREFDEVWVYDNSMFNQAPAHVITASGGSIVEQSAQLPAWVVSALKFTEFDPDPGQQATN